MPTINLDTAQQLDIEFHSGQTFEMSLSDVLIDGSPITSDYDAAMKIRESEGGTVIKTWETPNEIIITSGTISWLVPAASNIADGGTYVYDLMITYPDGTVQPWLWGRATVNPTMQ